MKVVGFTKDSFETTITFIPENEDEQKLLGHKGHGAKVGDRVVIKPESSAWQAVRERFKRNPLELAEEVQRRSVTLALLWNDRLQTNTAECSYCSYLNKFGGKFDREYCHHAIAETLKPSVIGGISYPMSIRFDYLCGRI